MDIFQDMKGPTRPAPSVPGLGINRYSPVTNWNDDPFGADVFEPLPHFAQKKKPPPRPPPPKVGSRQPDIPVKPSHFIRKPTVLSSLLSRKNKTIVNNQNVNIQNITPDFKSEVDNTRVFPKCEPKIVQTGALIDLSSPPSSPTFTTRSSSDGLSVDSFSSDATTSTNHHNTHNGGSASQTESGFEDDFDLFLNSRKAVVKEDTIEDFTALDPFSPQPVLIKPPLLKKPVLNKDLYELSSISSQPVATTLKGPTIIRAKPARPRPPDNAALLRNTFGSSLAMTAMNVNTTAPIQRVSNGFGDNFESKLFNWDDVDGSPEREPSPPMPTIPPPPPPVGVEDESPGTRSRAPADLPADTLGAGYEDEEPYAIAVFDYFTDHEDDLCFSTNSRITLIRRVDHAWLYGSLRSGARGMFPANHVQVRVPLPDERSAAPPPLGRAIALYDFEPAQPGDLRLVTGDAVLVRSQLNDQWYTGECNGARGQFPINYVQMS